MIGFRFSETMSGTYALDGGAERPVRFEITVRTSSWLRHLRDRRAALAGLLTMDGFATDVAVTGELIIDPLIRRRIHYTLRFTADDGRRCTLTAEKQVSYFALVTTMTAMDGTIDSDQGRIGHAHLTFDISSLPRFLASVRPTI